MTSSCSTSETICVQCGNRGFINAFVYCVKCLKVAVHRYCLDVIPNTTDEFVKWFCDDCGAKVQNQPAVQCKTRDHSTYSNEQDMGWRRTLPGLVRPASPTQSVSSSVPTLTPEIPTPLSSPSAPTESSDPIIVTTQSGRKRQTPNLSELLEGGAAPKKGCTGTTSLTSKSNKLPKPYEKTEKRKPHTSQKGKRVLSYGNEPSTSALKELGLPGQLNKSVFELTGSESLAVLKSLCNDDAMAELNSLCERDLSHEAIKYSLQAFIRTSELIRRQSNYELYLETRTSLKTTTKLLKEKDVALREVQDKLKAAEADLALEREALELEKKARAESDVARAELEIALSAEKSITSSLRAEMNAKVITFNKGFLRGLHLARRQLLVTPVGQHFLGTLREGLIEDYRRTPFLLKDIARGIFHLLNEGRVFTLRKLGAEDKAGEVKLKELVQTCVCPSKVLGIDESMPEDHPWWLPSMKKAAEILAHTPLTDPTLPAWDDLPYPVQPVPTKFLPFKEAEVDSPSISSMSDNSTA